MPRFLKFSQMFFFFFFHLVHLKIYVGYYCSLSLKHVLVLFLPGSVRCFFFPESQVHMGGKTYDIDCISLAEAPDDWTLIQVQCSLNAPGRSVSKSNYRLVESHPLPYSMCMGKYIYTYLYIYIYDVYFLMCMGHISIYVYIYRFYLHLD